MHSLQPIAIKLSGCAVVPLLNRLVLQVVDLEELKCCLVSAIDQHSELQVVEVRIFNRLNKADLNRVVNHVDSKSAVLAQKDSVVDTDMGWVSPAAVKAVLVGLFF